MYLAISSAAFPAISVRGVLAYRKTTIILVEIRYEGELPVVGAP